jgi:glycosyltransferase involved in cell wall biosynthesis
MNRGLTKPHLAEIRLLIEFRERRKLIAVQIIVNTMKILAIIASYNSANALPVLITGVREYIPDILVVDDGSSDETSSVAQGAGAVVIRHDFNRGKGAALKSGFNYAVEKEYDSVITLDSDGQHNPKYIPAFLEVVSRTNADFVIGSRIDDKADMPLDRRFSNWATSRILSWLLKTPVDDLQCGYRYYSSALLKSINLQSERYELETEVVIKAVQAGFKPIFIPVRVEYGPAYTTGMNRLVDTLRWLRLVLDVL